MKKNLSKQYGNIKLISNNYIFAGEFTTIKLVYSAGYYGIDDTGSIKLSYRFASDMGQPQFSNPILPNFSTVKCSNRSVELLVRFDKKMNVRPWDKTIYIKLIKGYLKKNDKVFIILGDKTYSSPGIRAQTFCENKFHFKLSVDPFATYKYFDLNYHTPIKILPTKPYKLKTIIPTINKKNKLIKINLIIEDLWGNPTFFIKDKKIIFHISNKSNFKINRTIIFKKNLNKITFTLKITEEGVFYFSFRNLKNIIHNYAIFLVKEKYIYNYYWGDIHGQSGETIGTNLIKDYFNFAKNIACLDVTCHQGNDFQIEDSFWYKINYYANKYNEDNKFVCFAGYEWSGNTGLGGDRNIIYKINNQSIYRSSLVLINKSTVSTTTSNVAMLHQSLLPNLKNVVSIPHIGGRYSDIINYFNPKLEKSIEIHSAWGTFEWLLREAFNKNYKVGILANSDDHKGRPGSSYPGASMFGSYGGLTCFISKKLSRKNIFECLKKRKHYATTGNRPFQNIYIKNIKNNFKLFNDLSNKYFVSNKPLIIGDIAQTKIKNCEIFFELKSADEIEKIEFFNKNKIIFTNNFLNKKDKVLKIIWSGAEYKGRGREVHWKGNLKIKDNQFSNLKSINFYNHNKKIILNNKKNIEWESTTTGGFSGFELNLKNNNGSIYLKIFGKEYKIEIKNLIKKNFIKKFFGLDKFIKIYLVSNNRPTYQFKINKKISLNQSNGLYIKSTFRYGHTSWTSPIYIDLI